jgi:hypothetical protein
MDLKEAQMMAINLMAKHGLTRAGWGIEFSNDSSMYIGRCDYNAKTIRLKNSVAAEWCAYGYRNLVLHEIAHALVGPDHDHNWVWRRQCHEIGAVPAAMIYRKGRCRCWLHGPLFTEPTAWQCFNFPSALSFVHMTAAENFEQYWYQTPRGDVGFWYEREGWHVCESSCVRPLFRVGSRKEAIEEAARRLVIAFKTAA